MARLFNLHHYKDLTDSKVALLMNHFTDMAVQGYGWAGMQ